jgi:thiosulfate dehydrogenase [quinone] large subunit
MASTTRSERARADPHVQGPEPDARRIGFALFPLRLFLGVTFVYGGIQKLTDPGYLHPGAPTYIGTQLQGFAHGTPGGFLLRALAIPHPRAAGIGVALVEIAIGLLVTTGVLARPAAAIGLALNLLLFLTNSWHTHPYFLGSDIVFVFAWVPFVLVGSSWQPTLEPLLYRLVAARRSGGRRSRPDERRAGRARPTPTASEPELTRRKAIGAALSLTGAATAAIAGLSVLSRGSYHAARSLSATTPPHTSARTANASSQAKTSPKPKAGAPPPDVAVASPGSLPAGAVKLGASSQLPAGQGATYPDPGDGNPDIVVRQANGSLVAHSAVCTHAGCTVGYQGGQIVCPCHGAVYDAQTGAVISGPASAPLASRKVIERAGEIYALRG